MLIPRYIQCQIMAALLQGKLPEGFTAEEIDRLYFAFEERWRHDLDTLLFAVQNEPEGVKRQSFISSFVTLSPKEREDIIAEAEREVSIPRLGELTLPEIEWVWKGWIPRGMLTLLGAMPSAGKSYLALDLARRVIGGMDFPDGSPVQKAGPVIYVDAEGVPQIHNQRWRAWGIDDAADLYLMGPAEGRLMIDLSEEIDRDRLVEWTFMKRPALIVVDSLSSISSRGENSVEDVRVVFSFLNRLAVDYRCGMVLIHHLRKPGAQLPLPKFLTFNDLRGSSHIVAMSRSIIGLHWVQTGPKQNLNDPRRMEVIKTNLGQYPEGIGVTFRPSTADPEVAELVYGEPPEPWEEPTKKVECTEWLVALLDEYGELPPKEVIELAHEQGFSESTVYRARRQLGDQVIDTQGKRHPNNTWALANEVEDEPENAESA
jgi:hypothetical protein